ncbi:unnamed protein product [Ixodes hexagonus]
MSTSKHKEIVLETIDQLRKRKARPDFERICHMLYRRHGLTKVEVQSELDVLVDAEVVIKVDYKGSTSYRNAAKWVRFNKSPLSDPAASAAAAATAVPVVPVSMSGHATTQRVSRMIGDAVRDLWCAGYTSSAAISPSEVEAYLQSKEAGIKLTKGALELAFEKEVAAGRLVRLAGGCYGLSDAEKQRSNASAVKVAPAMCSPKPSKPPMVPREQHQQSPVIQNGQSAAPPPPPNAVVVVPETRVSIGGALIGSNAVPNGRPVLQGSAGKRARPLSKRKRIKKTHGPDFLENLDSPTMEATEFFEDDEPHCFICCLTAASNTTRDVEALLVCRDCNARAHPSCLNYSPELKNVAQLSSWQCIDCKTCAVCNTNTESDDLLVCDNCDKGYHQACHKPKVANRPIGKWLCKSCSEPGKKSSGLKVKMEVDPPAGLPTPCDSPVPEDELKDSDEEPHMDLTAYFNALDRYPDTIPDAKCWSIDEVEKFLVHVGFPEQASAFRDQEIDGRSLLLLKRSDVLTGLSIKLGPALKIYNHIKRLQTGLPNGHLY